LIVLGLLNQPLSYTGRDSKSSRRCRKFAY
jgi:hypothetical protein